MKDPFLTPNVRKGSFIAFRASPHTTKDPSAHPTPQPAHLTPKKSACHPVDLAKP
jgi:hypothetical protein